MSHVLMTHVVCLESSPLHFQHAHKTHAGPLLAGCTRAHTALERKAWRQQSAEPASLPHLQGVPDSISHHTVALQQQGRGSTRALL